MQHSIHTSPLGPFFLWFQAEQLIYASFQKIQGEKFLARHFPGVISKLRPLPQGHQQDLELYFRGQKLDFNWRVQLMGTDFQKRVWAEIKNIPHGQFTTYKKIGEHLNTRAYRAIGQAVGANPISIIIPCHRVLGTNSLGGYGGGINLKRLLLELENVTLVPNLRA